MQGGVFLLTGSDLVALRERAYDSEDLLQALLEHHPELLAGDQVGDEARRWLLVRREAGVPGHEGGGGRWSLDHVFIDNEAIPTLVEVKRSGDTRIRREVVGQMLDYAANGIVYWPADRLRAEFEARCERDGLDLWPPSLTPSATIASQTSSGWESNGTCAAAGCGWCFARTRSRLSSVASSSSSMSR